MKPLCSSTEQYLRNEYCIKLDMLHLNKLETSELQEPVSGHMAVK